MFKKIVNHLKKIKDIRKADYPSVKLIPTPLRDVRVFIAEVPAKVDEAALNQQQTKKKPEDA